MDNREADRRATFKLAVLAYFKAHPMQWIDSAELERVGGRMAWRTRVSDARKIVKAEGGTIRNRLNRQSEKVISEYMYTPYQPLGREASERVTQKALF